ncbi:MAG: transposase, partial [Akkermansia sp.]
DALDQVRREELSKASEMNRRLISNSRYLLLKGRENVAEDKVNRLNQLLLSNRKISDGYVLKEQFREIYKAKDVNGGIWRLSEWLRMTRASSIEPLREYGVFF